VSADPSLCTLVSLAATGVLVSLGVPDLPLVSDSASLSLAVGPAANACLRSLLFDLDALELIFLKLLRIRS